MKILFWNVRGVGKSHRRKLVANHVLQEDLDVVAIQETIKLDFEDGELKEMAGNKAMAWHWIPANGHLGGLAVGVNTDMCEIEDTKYLQYSLWVLIRNRLSNFRYWVVDIYGPAQHEYSEDFILELTNTCSLENLPMVLGGDFNLIRNNSERNKGQGDQKLMDLFNNFIGNFQLREIYVNGPKFTWSNKQRNPILIKLDRILVSDSWETNFPTCHAWSKARVGSDHCPLILNSGEIGMARPSHFSFNEQWLFQEGFGDMVQIKWKWFRDAHLISDYSLDIWHGCLLKLRQFLKGWNLRWKGEQRANKDKIVKRIQELDFIIESRLLSTEEWEERIGLEDNLERIFKLEEIYWRQKSGQKWTSEGDANTHFSTNLLMGEGGKTPFFS